MSDARREAEEQYEKMLQHVHFLALGQIVIMLLSEEFRRSGRPKEVAENWLKLTEGVADLMTFPQADPALSDLAAQEFRDCLVRHVHRARAIATGEPFDPESYRRRAS